MRADGAGVGALLVAEELRLQELAREAGAVHVDERLVGARAVAVEPAREDALAAARLALDQDRAARGGDLARVLGQPRGSRPRCPVKGSTASRAWRARPADLAALLALALEQPPQHHQQRRQLDRLGQELVGAFLDRAHGQVDRGVAGQHHHRQRRVDLADPGQQLERRAVGQHVVEHHRVGVALAHDLLGGRAACPPPPPRGPRSRGSPGPRSGSRARRRRSGSSARYAFSPRALSHGGGGGEPGIYARGSVQPLW